MDALTFSWVHKQPLQLSWRYEQPQTTSSALPPSVSKTALQFHAVTFQQSTPLQPPRQRLVQACRSIEEVVEACQTWTQLRRQLQGGGKMNVGCKMNEATLSTTLFECDEALRSLKAYLRKLYADASLFQGPSWKQLMSQPPMKLEKPSRTTCSSTGGRTRAQPAKQSSRPTLSSIKRVFTGRLDGLSRIPLEQCPLFETKALYDFVFTVGASLNRDDLNFTLKKNKYTIRSDAEPTVENYSDFTCGYLRYDVESTGLGRIRMGLRFKTPTLPFRNSQQQTYTLTLSVFGNDVVQEMVVVNSCIIERIIRGYTNEQRGGRVNQSNLFKTFKEQISWSDDFRRSWWFLRKSCRIQNCFHVSDLAGGPPQTRSAISKNTVSLDELRRKRPRIVTNPIIQMANSNPISHPAPRTQTLREDRANVADNDLPGA